MSPTIGRIVHYTLSNFDADQINRRRDDFSAAQSASAGLGYVGHVGNRATAGDVCPAIVVRTFGGPAVNLQVQLDGTDTFWATSRTEGEGEGHWAWPPRL